MTKLIGATASVLLLLVATSAQAQRLTDRDVDVMLMIQKEMEFDASCRGGTDRTTIEYSCEARDGLVKQLNRRGWCYGKRNQIGADMKWHRCTRSSNR